MSISKILSSISKRDMSLPETEGVLENPDVPSERHLPKKFNDRQNIHDRYYEDMSKRYSDYNGMGALKPEYHGWNARDMRQHMFLSTGGMDPNVIRARTDPDHALPTTNITAKFSLMPSAVKPPTDNVSLVAQSHKSEYNYRNRYNIISGDNQNPQPPSYEKSREDPIMSDQLYRDLGMVLPSYEESTDPSMDKLPQVDDISQPTYTKPPANSGQKEDAGDIPPDYMDMRELPP